MSRFAAFLVTCWFSWGSVAEAKPSQKDIDDLLASTDSIAAKVSKLRGLAIKKPIDRGIMSREQVQERLIKRLDEEYSSIELREEGRALKRLGLLPEGTDYRKLVLDLMTEQIAGFYDPKERKLYIADWIDSWMQTPVMAHEIDHALQDQAFNLDGFIKPMKENSDEQAARQALVEGDGLMLMLQYMYRESGYKSDPWAQANMVELMRRSMQTGTVGGEQMALLQKAPLVLREQLLFPYLTGLDLMAHTLRIHAWSRIDEMYRNPPVSTEQVMHPEKYPTEKPIAVKLPTMNVLKGFAANYRNVLGELGFSVWFRQHKLSDERAKVAAEGWGGDRLAIFSPAGDDGVRTDELIAVSLSAWDTDVDAAEAFDAASDAELDLSGTAEPQSRTPTYVVYADAAGDVSFVERKGTRLVVVIGAPATLAAKIRTEVWAKWKKQVR